MKSSPRINKQSESEKLSHFLMSTANLFTFSASLAPLITVDCTSVHPLLEIKAETEDKYSQNAKILHQTSSRTLSVLDKIDSLYQTLFSDLSAVVPPSKQKQRSQTIKQKKKNQVKSFVPNYKKQEQFIERAANDQNVDLSNFQPKFSKKQKNQHKDLNARIELKEIIRPQYRKIFKKIQKQDQFLEKSSSEEETNIPIVSHRKNQVKCHRTMTPTSGRSVSPKVEARHKRQKQLTNISSISKKVQTDSCLSFDIDLAIPQPLHPNQSSHSLTSQTEPSPYPEYKPRSTISNIKRPQDSGEIEQQQPWQCDEEELEEELRQINERLSHRNCPQQTQIQEEILGQSNEGNSSKPKNEVKNQPKTVRLSLTPQKRKPSLSPHSRQKIEIVNIIRTPTKSPEIKKETSELRCQKWKKPKKGYITVDIQRYM